MDPNIENKALPLYKLYRDYHSYRMVNVVLMENLPQLVIQIVFAAQVTGNVPLMSLLAAITSVLSIIVAIVDHFSKKELTKQAVPSTLITFQITSNAISAAPSKYKNRQKKVIRGVSKILVLDQSAIEILTINEYSDQMGDGLIVHFLITTVKYKPNEIHQKLKDSVINGSMARNMSKAWDLVPHDPPIISHLRWLKIQSEQTEGAETTFTTNNNNYNTNGGSPKVASTSNLLKKRIVVKARDTLMDFDKIDLNKDDNVDVVAISPIRNDAITNHFNFDGDDKDDVTELEMQTVNHNKNQQEN